LLDLGMSLTCVVAAAGCSGFLFVEFRAVWTVAWLFRCVGVLAAKTCEFLPLTFADRSSSFLL